MKKLKNLKNLDSAELQEYLNSFDDVLIDLDGVLFKSFSEIPGAKDGFLALQKLNKRTYIVSNSCGLPLDMFHKLCKKRGFILRKENIVYPTMAIVSYLKSINFNKKIYVIGSQSMRKDLVDAGLCVSDQGKRSNFQPQTFEENINAEDIVEKKIEDDPDIGAVIVDPDFDENFVHLSKAILHLKRKDVKFITGNGQYHSELKTLTQREAEVFGKPDIKFFHFMQKTFGLRNLQRTVYIGDSITEDMGFAAKCGLKKLLVLTGNTKIEELVDIPHDLRPDYYLDSIADFSQMIEKNLDYIDMYTDISMFVWFVAILIIVFFRTYLQ